MKHNETKHKGGSIKYREKESSILEFKRTLPKDDQIIKTIVGFCNQQGGRIVLGVDNNGTMVGLLEDDIHQVLEYLEKSIFESTLPPIIPRISIQTIGDKVLLIIDIPFGMNKPYFVRSEGKDKGTYVRLGRSTLRATADIIEELHWQARGLSFDCLPVYHATVQDLDDAAIQRFFKMRKGPGQVPVDLHEALLAYDLVTIEHGQEYPTVAGILLFGRNPQRFFSEAMIIGSHFRGESGRHAIATKDCLGTLFSQYEQVFEFAVNQLNRSFVIEGTLRQETLEIPEQALREVLLNVIAHRNYHMNSPSKVAIYDNRLEIFSPGGFPGPLNVHHLKAGLTYIRNRAIIKVLREMGYIEKLGTGFITLFDSYEKRELPTPQVIEGENYIKCILPRARMKQQVSVEESAAEILQLFQVATALSISDIIKLTQIPRSTINRKLKQLLEQGLLKKKGIGRATRYFLT